MTEKSQHDARRPRPKAPPPAGRIVITPKRSTTARLRLVGPTTLAEGRELAARLNAVIARYNTLYFKKKDGTDATGKIAARTSNPRECRRKG